MTEHAYGPTGAGTVMLDLGPDTGALVLYTPAYLAGREIEISPHTPDARRAQGLIPPQLWQVTWPPATATVLAGVSWSCQMV